MKDGFVKKIAILGEGGVGKTTLMYQYIKGEFVDVSDLTMVSDFFTKDVITTVKGVEVQGKLSIWDLAGQDRFRFLIKDNLRGTEGVILAYDMSRLITILKLKDWIEILKEAKIPLDGSIPILLIGTKKDRVQDDKDEYQREEYINNIKDMCKIAFEDETSALSGENVKRGFDFLIEYFGKKELKQIN